MKNYKLLGGLFLIIAIVSIVFAIVCFNMEVGNTEWFETYGGDAYTGIQNAAAQTANNVIKTNTCIKTIGGFAFIIIGLAFGSIGISFVSNSKNEENTENNNLSSTAKCESVNSDSTINNKQYTCPSCGRLVLYGTQFCPSCSQRFNWDNKS